VGTVFPQRAAVLVWTSKLPGKSEGGGETQVLTIKAASRQSGIELVGALATFGATLIGDDDGGCFVNVELGNDQRTLEVFATISDVVAQRSTRSVVASMSVAKDDAPAPTT
jgi:hypothetical protein